MQRDQLVQAAPVGDRDGLLAGSVVQVPELRPAVADPSERRAEVLHRIDGPTQEDAIAYGGNDVAKRH